jgi:hypothetical protein
MPAGTGEDAERFADAVEQGRPPGFCSDAKLAQQLEIVAMLRSRGAAYSPDPDAKAQAKQRLMAVLAGSQDLQPASSLPAEGTDSPEMTELLQLMSAPRRPAERLAAEGLVDDRGAVADGTRRIAAPAGARPGRHKARHSMPTRPPGRSHSLRRAASEGIGQRFIVVASAALVMALALAGTGTLASRNALPGDDLYGVKRVAESAGLALTFDDVAKARRHFELATTRLDEVERLLAAQPPADPELVAFTIRQFDESTGEGARMLLASENGGGDPVALESLRSWATAQSARLSELGLALPPGPEAGQAIRLLDRLVGRTQALTVNSSCGIAVPDAVDDLGPVPTSSACSRRARDASARNADPSTSSGHGPSSGPGSAEGSTTPTDPSTTDNGSHPDPRSSTGTSTQGDTSSTRSPGTPSESSTKGETSDGDASSDTQKPVPDESNPTTTAPDTSDDNGDQGDSVLPDLPSVDVPPLVSGLPGIGL